MSNEQAQKPTHYTSPFPVETVEIQNFFGRNLFTVLVDDPQFPTARIPEVISCLFCATKYFFRLGRKDDWKTELKKVMNYLNRCVYGKWLPVDLDEVNADG